MSMHSGDIRDQSRQLSEIAPNFGRFFALPNFRGRTFQKLYPHYHPCHAARLLEKKFSEDTPTSSEVIEAHTLNFKANFKFLPLIFFFFGGGTPFQFGCALGSLGQSLVR